MRVHFRNCLMHGQWPWWNPYMGLGMPAQTGPRPLYSPLVLATIWLPTAVHIKVSIWLHLSLSIGFMGCLLRAHGLTRVACLAGGIVYGYSGFGTGHLYAGHLDWLEVQPYYPLLAWTSLTAMRRAGGGWWMLMTLTVSLTVLGGHYQSIYLTIGSLVAFQTTLVLLGSNWPVPKLSLSSPWLDRQEPRSGRDELLAAGVSWSEKSRDLWQLFLRWLMAAIASLALCAFQLMPSIESLLCSNRLNHSSEFTASQPGPIFWMTSLLPTFFDAERVLAFWSFWPSMEANMYLGIASLVLLLLACPWKQRRNWFPLAIIFLLAAFLTLGPASPLYRLLTKIDPILMGNFRSATRFGQVTTFFGAWLVALGVDNLRFGRIWVCLLFPGLPLVAVAVWLGQFHSHPEDWADFVYSLCDQNHWHALADPKGEDYRTILVRATDGLAWSLKLAAAFLCLALVPPRHRASCALLLLFTDLYLFGRPYVKMNEEKNIGIPAVVRDTLERELGNQRVLFDPELHWLNRGMMWGFSELACYDSMANPAYQWTVNLVENCAADKARTILEPWNSHPVWDLCGLALIVSSNAQPPPWPNLAFIQGSERVFRNPRAQTRAFMVASTEWNPDRLESVKQVVADPDRARGVAIINGPAPAPKPLAPVTQYKVERLVLGANQVHITLETNGQGLLVLNDAWWPGWRVRVDGNWSTIYCLNGGLQRGAWLEAGRHEVVFDYWPASLTKGLVISSSAMLLLSLWIALGYWKKKRASEA
ncbi:MAG: YfhO family protein [Vulcanimicrobiota bacterium]